MLQIVHFKTMTVAEDVHKCRCALACYLAVPMCTLNCRDEQQELDVCEKQPQLQLLLALPAAAAAAVAAMRCIM